MNRRDEGSVFVEALVACAVVAAVLAGLFEVIEASARRRVALETRREALMIARSEIAAVGVEIPVAPGQIEGVQDDYRWRVRVDQPLAQSAAISRAGQLYPISVSVAPARGGADLIVLNTLRLASAQ
jgi:general secretion pathway protein I